MTAGQGMLAPALPIHQGINFQRGGKDFGAEGDGVSVERCRCMCRAMVCAAVLLAGIFQGAMYCCQATSVLQCVVLTVQCMCMCACSFLGASALL